jgi:hypothetical protein
MNDIRFVLLVGATMSLLGGCTSKPVLLNASEEGVMVRYDPTAVTPDEAAAAAQASCAKYGRNAVPQNTALTGEAFTSFSCVK